MIIETGETEDRLFMLLIRLRQGLRRNLLSRWHTLPPEAFSNLNSCLSETVDSIYRIQRRVQQGEWSRRQKPRG